MIDEIIFNIMAKGVPDYLQKLFSIEKKAELQKHCRDITVKQEDLVSLIMNCHSIGYSHQRKHHEFIPKHLMPEKGEVKVLESAKVGKTLTGDAKKFINKIGQIFKQRRLLSVHVFYNENKWHLFYFDQEDANEPDNHWKHGSHVHFVNYLWPSLDVNNLWDFFDKVESGAAGKLHIRYKGQKRASGDDL